MERRPVVVRTLDIGGDKEAPGLRLPTEAEPLSGRARNPALPESTRAVSTFICARSCARRMAAIFI